MKKILFLLLLGFGITASAQQYYDSLSDIKREVNKGNAQGMYDMGCCYYNGSFGIEQDFKSAVDWFRKAADKGNSNAMYMLGCCYINEEGVELDYIEGLEYLRLAVQKGHKKAQIVIDNIVGKGYKDWGEIELYGYHNKGVLSDYQINGLKEKAKNGDAYANLMLGYAYKNIKDYIQAFQYFMTASLCITEKDLEFGELLPMEICDQIGWCYEYGLGTKQDYQKAIEYYEKSDLDSGIEPKSKLDSLCLNLREWWDMDINAEIANVHENLCYLRMGVQKVIQHDSISHDLGENTKWVGRHPFRSLWHAECYYRGMGVDKDLEMSKKLFEVITDDESGYGIYRLPASRIAPHVYADACYRLYEFYKNGIGCKRNPVMASAYFNMALKYGSTSAIYDDQIEYDKQNK